MTKKLRWFLPILVAILGILAFVMPVLASIPQPTTLEIQEITAYENAQIDGGQLYLVPYQIEFATLPDDGADQLFLFRLLDEDGEELAWATPFPFHDKGYGMGVVAFYLEPDDAPDWASNLTVQLIGSPFADWGGNVPSTTLTTITWNTNTTAVIQDLLTSKILELAARLGDDWGVEMVTTVQGITTLSSIGASYFSGVVPYFAQVAPKSMGQYIFTPDYPIDEKPADDTYAAELEAAIHGTIFDLSGVARSWGISRGALTAGIYYAFVIAFFVMLIVKKGLKKGMMLLLWPFVIAGAFFGVPLVVTILGGFLCLISTVWVFYKGVS